MAKFWELLVGSNKQEVLPPPILRPQPSWEQKVAELQPLDVATLGPKEITDAINDGYGRCAIVILDACVLELNLKAKLFSEGCRRIGQDADKYAPVSWQYGWDDVTSPRYVGYIRRLEAVARDVIRWIEDRKKSVVLPILPSSWLYRIIDSPRLQEAHNELVAICGDLIKFEFGIEPKTFRELKKKYPNESYMPLIAARDAMNLSGNYWFDTERVEIPLNTRFEHQLLIAPPGSGKTTALLAQMHEDFQRVARDECSIIVIDGEKRKDYLAPQIEPKSLRTLRLGFQGAAKRNSGCAANLNCKARSLYAQGRLP